MLLSQLSGQKKLNGLEESLKRRAIKAAAGYRAKKARQEAEREERLRSLVPAGGAAGLLEQVRRERAQ